MTASARLVVVSPHLDDAVLSVGGVIRGAVVQGRSVQVWTAFTSGPPPQELPAGLRRFADYATRLAEDDRALEVLGAGSRRLGLPEGLWRSAPRARPAARMLPAAGLLRAFRTPSTAAGFTQLPVLADLIAELLSDPDAEVLAPLGVGHHVDHVEVMLAAVAAADRTGAWSRLSFYEDFYALGLAARHRHPVTRRRPSPPWLAPGWAAPAEGAVLLLTALLASGPAITRYRPGLAALDWHCQAHPLTARDEELKLAAVSRYASQTPALGGMARLGAVLRRSHRVRGGELIWRAHSG